MNKPPATFLTFMNPSSESRTLVGESGKGTICCAFSLTPITRALASGTEVLVLTKVSLDKIVLADSDFASSTLTSAAAAIIGLRSTKNEAKEAKVEMAFEFSEEWNFAVSETTTNVLRVLLQMVL